MTGVALAMVGLAECAAGHGEFVRAARLYGASHAVFESLGMSFHPFNTWPDFHERFVNLTRHQLGDSGVAAMQAEGQAMTFERAVEYALELE